MKTRFFVFGLIVALLSWFVPGGVPPAMAADPFLTWNTFLGSAESDRSIDIALDAAANVYIAGWSSADWGDPVNSHAGGIDAFVAKLDSGGNLVWNTFLGSAGADYGNGVAVDGGGNVYVVGRSDAFWGSNSVRPHAGGDDVFVAKLDSSGARVWNTFLGSGSEDRGRKVAVDGFGNVYVVGYSAAAWGSPTNPFTGSSYSDALVAKLNGSGQLQWHAFLGSTASDDGMDLAVDGSGNVYVVGNSNAAWGGLPVNAFAGGRDAFVAQLNSSGAVQWNTFAGSTGADYGYSLALDGAGKGYVAGFSDATWGSPVNPHAGDFDAFVAQLNSSGVRQWSTFLGGTGLEQGEAIATDGAGRVYVAGLSGATWGRPIKAHAGGQDAFVAQLNESGVRQWHSFLGLASGDEGLGVAAGGGGNVYVTGYSGATWGTPVHEHSGGDDAFVAKLHAVMLAGVAVSGPGVGLVGTSYPFTATVSPITATVPITYVWQAVEQTPAMVTHTNSLSDSISFAWGTTGIKSITVTADNAISGTVTGATTTTITMTATSQLACYLPVLLKDCNADAYEPNDIAAQAYTLTTNTTLAANFCGDDTKDEFKFHIDSLGKTIGITMTQVPAGSNYDLYLHLMPNTSKAVAQSIKTGNADEHISYSPTQTGDYLVYVYAQTKGPSAGRQDYRLEVTFK